MHLDPGETDDEDGDDDPLLISLTDGPLTGVALGDRCIGATRARQQAQKRGTSSLPQQQLVSPSLNGNGNVPASQCV